MFKLIAVIGFLFGALSVNAENEYTKSLEKHPVVSTIELQGLSRTKPFVIHRELRFKVSDTLTAENLLLSIQNLKNLEIFSSVIPILKLKSGNHVHVIIQFTEKWTTIPYLNYSSGGGTRYLYAGIYDINMFGNFVELGVQYNRWNDEDGALGWYIDRRAFNQRITLRIVAGATLRPRNLRKEDGEIEGEYVLSRNEFSFSLAKEFKTWLRIGAVLDYQEDKIINTAYETSLEPAIKAQLESSHTSANKFVSLFLALGKLNYHNYLTEGKLSSLTVMYSGNYTDSDSNIKKIRWNNQAYWRLPYHANIALQFKLEQTDATTIQHLFYVGGFKHIRGFFDDQFRSNAYWQANAEYRIPSYRSNWLVLQHVFFVDAVQVADSIYQLKNEKRVYYSAGTGIRIISPKIYSFNGRFDIALVTTGKSENVISFGVHQFF